MVRRVRRTLSRITLVMSGLGPLSLSATPTFAQTVGAVPTVPAAYDSHLPPASSVLALQNDMRRVDRQLSAIERREEYPGLARIAVAIRGDIRALEDQMREHIQGRHEVAVGGLAEVNWLRQRILELRGAINALPPATTVRPQRRRN